jgi:hypothetical protein
MAKRKAGRPLQGAKKTNVRRKPAAARSSAKTTIRSGKQPRLDRVRRTLVDTVPTPPSSLNMDRRGSAVRTGLVELAEKRPELAGMTDLAAGDPDVDKDRK